MPSNVFRNLQPRDRALVTIAVLLDGREAENYLRYDQLYGASFAEAAKQLAKHLPELRMPVAGTFLRQAIEEMKR